jgi:hypothetical protein
MSPAYDTTRRSQPGPEDIASVMVLAGCAVLAAFWYVAVSRLRMTNSQCLEIFLDSAIGFFGAGLVLAHFVGRKNKREEHWPHPALAIPASKDEAIVQKANLSGATVLGYDVHGKPWLWPDTVRLKHGVIAGGTGAGKTTFLRNIISQDMHRRFGDRRMPIIIFDGKGDTEFLEQIISDAEAAGRLQDLRVLDPSNPNESVRYNMFHSADDLYQEHVNFIFQSFGLRKDFFEGHQEAYLSDLVRILHYTGKIFNARDVLVMALDDQVLAEQIAIAKGRIATLPGLSIHQRLNLEMSIRSIQQSLKDRDRVEKIQGLLNELVAFLEDELSVVTGSYQDLLTTDEVVDKGLILVISLNGNKNRRAADALGKVTLQNIQLTVGKRYGRTRAERDPEEPMLSVIFDEIARFATPGFAHILQTARGARVSFLFSLQAVPQLQSVGQAFADEVLSAPGTKMIMNGSEENTAQWFLKASSRVVTKRRSLSVRRTGLFTPKYIETGTGSESDTRETRSREDHIKNLPVGQMEILMADAREGTLHSHLHVRRHPSYKLEDFVSGLYPKMHNYLDPGVGANLRFHEKENRQTRRRSSGSLLSLMSGE